MRWRKGGGCQFSGRQKTEYGAVVPGGTPGDRGKPRLERGESGRISGGNPSASLARARAPGSRPRSRGTAARHSKVSRERLSGGPRELQRGPAVRGRQRTGGRCLLRGGKPRSRRGRNARDPGGDPRAGRDAKTLSQQSARALGTLENRQPVLAPGPRARGHSPI